MLNQITAFIEAHYDIPPIREITPLSGGFLSHNFACYADDDRAYFLKQYRFEDRNRVVATHQAKHFFAQAGIPVILPIASKSNQTFFTAQNQFYALFPFIAGRHIQRGTFSDQALISTAQMQARIHRAGKGVSLPHVKRTKLAKDYAAFVTTAKTILAKLPQRNQSPFDQLAAETLHLKLKLASQNQTALSQLSNKQKSSLAVDHLAHGDYQDANLFFTDDDQVTYVFDWEKVEITNRGLPLARAMDYICFSNATNYVAVYSAENYAKARCYLKAYHDTYPLSQQIFRLYPNQNGA